MIPGAERCFDNAATTPLDPRVLAEMMPWLQADFGNPHSLHHWGRKAMAAVERARESVAELIGAEDPSEVVFTSGATESNNWALRIFPNTWISPFEHSSLWEPAQRLGRGILRNDGWTLSLPPGAEPDLIAVMAVNNETGAILEAPDASAPRLVDATQAAGKTALPDWDLLSLSAHKLHGPKGVGALAVRGGLIEPLLVGGDQEEGRRAGTLNVPAIVGFGAAARIAREEPMLAVDEMRAAVMEGLSSLSDWRTNDHSAQSPFILSLSFLGVEGESLVVELDAAGFGISSGAACSSRRSEPSHVLTALGIEPEWLRGTVRISFGRFNRLEQAHDLGQALRSAVQAVRR